MKKYEWTRRLAPIEADVVGAELDRIRDSHGRVTPPVVVDEVELLLSKQPTELSTEIVVDGGDIYQDRKHLPKGSANAQRYFCETVPDGRWFASLRFWEE